MKYEFRRVKEHIEVFLDGVFQFSADSIPEAERELGESPENKGVYAK